MFNKQLTSSKMNRINRTQMISSFPSIYLYLGLVILTLNQAGAQPSFLLPQANEIVDDTTHKPDQAGETVAPPLPPSSSGGDLVGFRQFIESGDRKSQVIGLLKSNASASELLELKENIAKAITRINESNDRQRAESMSNTRPQDVVAECFIEVTRVEKIPGRCRRMKGGQPICESNQLMSITNECK